MGTLEYVVVELSNGDSLTVHRKIISGDPLEKNEEITVGIDPNQAYVYGGEYQSMPVL